MEVPGLDRRREDIPLLLRHLLAAARRDNPRAVERFFERREAGPGVARIGVSGSIAPEAGLLRQDRHVAKVMAAG